MVNSKFSKFRLTSEDRNSLPIHYNYGICEVSNKAEFKGLSHLRVVLVKGSFGARY